ncbi:hypothetical protein UACE39S_01406 [Ureibacillus acetophenoni]
MYIKEDKSKLLKIYRNEIKKNLERKYKIPKAKAEIGIKKFGFDMDFLEYTEDYEFVEPERVAIEVYEDVLEDAYFFKINDKYVLGTLRKARVPNFKKVNRIVGIPTRTSAAKAK